MSAKKLPALSPLMISFILAGLMIGLLVAAQFQSSVTANSYLIDELKAQEALMADFDEEKKILQDRIAQLRTRIEENRQKLTRAADQASLSILDPLREKLGLTKLRGAGVRLILSEGQTAKPESNLNLVHAADLRDLINLLRTAKVEGISVNNQRITPSTTINAVGSEIMVNKVKVYAPLEINVIGDSELIAARLGDKSAYPDLYDRILKKELGLEMQSLSQITLPVYDGAYLLKYAQNDIK